MGTDDSWNLVYAYSREQAITDGVLVDVTETAKAIGFRLHTVVTDHLFHVSENWASKGWLLRNGSSDGYQKQIPIPGTSVNSKMQKVYFYCISKEAFKTDE